MAGVQHCFNNRLLWLMHLNRNGGTGLSGFPSYAFVKAIIEVVRHFRKLVPKRLVRVQYALSAAFDKPSAALLRSNPSS